MAVSIVDENTRNFVADCFIKHSAEYRIKFGKRCSDTMSHIRRMFPQLHLNINTVNTWVKRRKKAKEMNENFDSLISKDRIKANNHRSSRSKLTDMQSYVMKKFLRKCLYESNFPMKGEIMTAMKKLMDSEDSTEITWQYTRRWLYRNGFSYKAIHKKSPGQILTIGKVEALNEFWTRCHFVYLDRQNKTKNAKIWCMDESGFNDGDNSKRGWGLRGGENQTQIQSTSGSDTFVGCVSNTGDIFSYFIKHTAATIEYDVDGDQIIQKSVKGMNTNIMKDWVSHFLRIASEGDILIMDNLKCHHSSDIVKKIHAAGVSIIYTPARLAYLVSPLDNFIFAFMKNRWRNWISSRNGYFSKEEKQEFLFELFQQVKNSELLMASFMRCGLPSYHPGLVQLDTTKPIEQHLTKGQLNELDTEWYKTSSIAQMMREKRIMDKLYHYICFADVLIICLSEGIETTENHEGISHENPSTKIETVFLEVESFNDHPSISYQLQHGVSYDQITIPCMMYNIDLVDYLEIRKQDFVESQMDVFLSNQHTVLNLLKKKIERLQQKTGLYGIIHDHNHFCGIFVNRGSETDYDIIIYDSLTPMSCKLVFQIEVMLSELHMPIRTMKNLQQTDSTSCGWFQLAFVQKLIEKKKEQVDAFQPFQQLEKLDNNIWLKHVEQCKQEFLEVLVEDYQILHCNIDLIDLQSQTQEISQHQTLSIEEKNTNDEQSNTEFNEQCTQNETDDKNEELLVLKEMNVSHRSLTIPNNLNIVTHTTDEEKKFIDQMIADTSTNQTCGNTMESQTSELKPKDVGDNFEFSSTLRINGIKVPVYSNQFDKELALKKVNELFYEYILEQKQRREEVKKKLEEINQKKRKSRTASLSTNEVNESIDLSILTQRVDKRRNSEGELEYQKAKRKKQVCISFPALDTFDSEEDFEESLSCLNYASLQKACKQNGLQANKKTSELKALMSLKFREMSGMSEMETNEEDGDDVMDDEDDENLITSSIVEPPSEENELPNFQQLYSMLGNTQDC